MTINQLYKKYKEMGTKFDTVYISQITNDLYQALQHQRIQRIPKDKR